MTGDVPALVREARVSDAAAIARVHVVSWQSAYRGIVPQGLLDGLSIAKRTEEWIPRLGTPDGSNWVLEVEGIVQGWASIGPSRDSDLRDAIELYGLYLTPGCWSKRLGHLLYTKAEGAMSLSRAEEVYLWVLEDNLRARRFYERVGYSPDGSTKNALGEGLVLPELRYRKSLRI